MKNWTIRRRITAGLALLMLLFLASSGVTTISLLRLRDFAASRLRDDTIPGMIYGGQMVEHVLRGHIRALMAGASLDPVKRDQFVEQVVENVQHVTAALKGYEDAMTADEDKRNFEVLKTRRAEYLKIRGEYLTLIKAGKNTEAEALAVEKLEPVFATFREILTTMLQWNQSIATSVSNEMARTARTASLIAAVGASISIVSGIFIGWIIVRGTNRVLGNVAETLSEGASQVVAAASQISAASQSLAESASGQAASLEETSASLEEMSSVTKRNVENTHQASGLAKEAREAAESGSAEMAKMTSAMASLKASSNDIAKIIKTIDEISFQTNILALNAAVEAARAGEAGMGFAVVAEEVRSLAQRCAQAARETSNQIETTINKSKEGAELTEKVATAFNDIVTRIRTVDELAAEVSNASGEQRQGIEQINTAMIHIDKVTQGNAAGAEESASAAEELNAQAESMKGSVNELMTLVGGRRRTAQRRTPSKCDSAEIATQVVEPRAGHDVDTVHPNHSTHRNGSSNGKIEFTKLPGQGVVIR